MRILSDTLACAALIAFIVALMFLPLMFEGVPYQ